MKHISVRDFRDHDLIAAAIALVDATVMLVPEAVYAPAKRRALARVPRDPEDWPTVALAMGLDAGIWTVDADFLGCGLPKSRWPQFLSNSCGGPLGVLRVSWAAPANRAV